MKVYCVFQSGWEDSALLKIFKSRADAETFKSDAQEAYRLYTEAWDKDCEEADELDGRVPLTHYHKSDELETFKGARLLIGAEKFQIEERELE